MSVRLGALSEWNKFHYYAITLFFDFLWRYDFPTQWVLSIFCSMSSIPALTNISTISLKKSSLLLLDTSGMPSILIHDRLPYCSNSSISFCSLTIAYFSFKIWFWNIQFSKLIFVICSSISFFISSFKSFLKLSKRAEHISLIISLNESLCFSKRSSILLVNSSSFYSIVCVMILTRNKHTKSHYIININNW